MRMHLWRGTRAAQGVRSHSCIVGGASRSEPVAGLNRKCWRVWIGIVGGIHRNTQLRAGRRLQSPRLRIPGIQERIQAAMRSQVATRWGAAAPSATSALPSKCSVWRTGVALPCMKPQYLSRLPGHSQTASLSAFSSCSSTRTASVYGLSVPLLCDTENNGRSPASHSSLLTRHSGSRVSTAQVLFGMLAGSVGPCIFDR